MNKGLEHILGRLVKHVTDPAERQRRIQVIETFGSTPEGRVKIIESWIPVARNRLDNIVMWLKKTSQPTELPYGREEFAAQTRTTDKLIAEANDFLGIAETDRERQDVAYRRLQALVEEMKGARDELAFRAAR